MFCKTAQMERDIVKSNQRTSTTSRGYKLLKFWMITWVTSKTFYERLWVVASLSSNISTCFLNQLEVNSCQHMYSRQNKKVLNPKRRLPFTNWPLLYFIGCMSIDTGSKSRSPKGDHSLLRRLFGQNWSPFTKKVSHCSK